MDLDQAVLIMTVEVKGQDTDDLTLALGEVLRLVNDGFTSGFDRNKSGAYRFLIAWLMMLKWTGSGGKFKFPSEPVLFFFG